MRTRPERPHGGDVLVIARASTLPRDAERRKLLLQPANAQTEFHPASRQLIEGRQLLGQHQGVALRHDENAGSQAQRWRCRSSERQPDERIRNRRVRLGGNFSVGGVGVFGDDLIRQDDVLAAPYGFKARGFGASANVQRRGAVYANAAGESESCLQVTSVQSMPPAERAAWIVSLLEVHPQGGANHSRRCQEGAVAAPLED